MKFIPSFLALYANIQNFRKYFRHFRVSRLIRCELCTQRCWKTESRWATNFSSDIDFVVKLCKNIEIHIHHRTNQPTTTKLQIKRSRFEIYFQFRGFRVQIALVALLSRHHRTQHRLSIKSKSSKNWRTNFQFVFH